MLRIEHVNYFEKEGIMINVIYVSHYYNIQKITTSAFHESNELKSSCRVGVWNIKWK